VHPVWDKIARWAEKDMGLDEPKARKEACTRRIPILLLLLALGAGYCYWANNIYPTTPGAYCDYPDPFHQ
jgi:hypothetical protein